jgi:hypothetical protein
MGLPLAEASIDGIPDRQYFEAIAKCVKPPFRQLPGLLWDPPEYSGNSCLLAEAFESAEFSPVASRVEKHLRDAGIKSAYEALGLVRHIVVPAASEVYVYENDLVRLGRYLKSGAADAELIYECDEWPHPIGEALPFAPPVGRGEVIPQDVSRFFQSYPSLAPMVERAMACIWDANAPSRRPKTATEVVRDMLGITVDIRVGRLLTPAQVDAAVELASGDSCMCGDPLTRDYIADAVHCRVLGVGRRGGALLPGLIGAAWSRDVDVVLNDAAVWEARTDYTGVRLGDEILQPT